MIIDYIFGYGIILHCIVLAIGLIGNALGIYLPFRVPFGIDASFVGLVFIHIGRVLHQGKRTERILDLKPLSSILIFTMGCSLIMINSYVNLRWGQYGIVPLFWISSVMTIVGLWNVCRLLDKRIKAKKIMHFIYNIGKDSIVYVCLNQLAILFSLRVLNKVQLPMWPRKVCVLIMTMLLLEGLRKTMIETKLKYLIGRQ